MSDPFADIEERRIAGWERFLIDEPDVMEENGQSSTEASGASVAFVAPWPAPLHQEAFHGLAGELIRAVEPHTEADPAALLIQLLVAFGNLLGRGAWVTVEADRHYPNLFTGIVGVTAKGRKGTAWGHIRRLVEQVDLAWTTTRIQGGLSSGEGLIWAVRDEIEKQEPTKDRGRLTGYQMVVEDPGIADKRLLVVETELASTLRVMGRDGSTLSPTIRDAWDTGDLRVLTKNSPAKATGAHISIIGHVTRDELVRYLDSTEAANGFANRFLWICARRSKLLPEGGQIQSVDFVPIVRKLLEVVRAAREVGQSRLDEDARAEWRRVYPELAEGKPGLFGSVTGRAEAQVLRLSLIYALLDGASAITKQHLRAALAVWAYAESSVRFIFGDSLGNPDADRIMRELRTAPDGLSRSEIRDLFARHRSEMQIESALRVLSERGLVHPIKEETAGRSIERWFAAGERATKAI